MSVPVQNRSLGYEKLGVGTVHGFLSHSSELKLTLIMWASPLSCGNYRTKYGEKVYLKIRCCFKKNALSFKRKTT